MNLAVKLFRDIDAGKRPLNVPLEWPGEIRPLGDSTILPDDGGTWQLMTLQQLADYKVIYQTAWDIWYAGFIARRNNVSEFARDTEFRFTTHDFAHPVTWDSRTNGDSIMWLKDAHPNAVYDDVNYQVTDGEAGAVLAKLSKLSLWNGGRVWYNPALAPSAGSDPTAIPDESILVKFDPAKADPTTAIVGQWIRTDTNAVVTSSKWSILPYNKTTMQVNEVWLKGRVNAIFDPLGPMIYMLTGYVDSFLASDGVTVVAVNSVVPMAVFQYDTVEAFEDGANIQPTYKPATVGDSNQNHFMKLGYDYTKTIPIGINADTSMRLDLWLYQNRPFQDTDTAKATFVGVKMWNR